MHLQYIVEIAKAGSISLAAERLYMNQPNLSKAVKELESSVGITIFKRTSRGMVPTPKGEEFIGYAKSILAQIDKMESIYKTEKANKIAFSLSAPRASYISHAFTLFVSKLDADKDLEINFKETNSMKTIKNVTEEEYNLGIIRYQKNHESYFLNFIKDKLEFETIWEFEPCLLMSKNNHLALADTITPADLHDGVEIVHGDLAVPYLSTTEAAMNQNKRGQRRQISIYERGSQFDLLNQNHKSYIWVSPLPQEQLDRYGVVQRKCSTPSPVYKDLLVYRKGYARTDVDERFLAELSGIRDDLGLLP
ncbi:LysR family transcriptional regulator [Gorillibacterium massiliense]|uniref:LysR family transcriptional regulator n=1 Tax=Gorillibacterium massiliense TaxID=1280390 RepID=UPI001EE3510D|nr:LysR family transcriptional regulator [Gorillibacterium massiliense]